MTNERSVLRRLSIHRLAPPFPPKCSVPCSSTRSSSYPQCFHFFPSCPLTAACRATHRIAYHALSVAVCRGARLPARFLPKSTSRRRFPADWHLAALDAVLLSSDTMSPLGRGVPALISSPALMSALLAFTYDGPAPARGVSPRS